jgi:hypothetical protein
MRSRFAQILATLVTAILAGLVVVGLTATRLGREPATAGPSPSPVPIAARDYGPPPADVNLLYVHDPDRPEWLIGFDWSGTPRATVKLDPSQARALMAPDGRTFSIGMNAKGGAWQFLDRLGKPIAAPSMLPGALLPMWADDNRHVCATSLDQQTLAWSLWTQLPGEAPKQVRVVATDATLGETNLRVIACSFKNDLAIAERITQAWPSEVWLIRLSDGAVLQDQKRSGTDVGMLTASADATLIAASSSRSTGQIDSTGQTVIVHTSDGSVAGVLDPRMGVLAFSGDNSLMLVTLEPWVGGQPINLAVVRPETPGGWQDDGRSPYFFGQFVAEPGGGSFAIAYPTTDQFPSLATIVIVRPDGSETKLDRLYTPAW